MQTPTPTNPAQPCLPTSQGWLSAAMVRAGDRIQVVHMDGVGRNFVPVWRTVTAIVLQQPDEDHVTIRVADLDVPPLIYTPDRSVHIRRTIAVTL